MAPDRRSLLLAASALLTSCAGVTAPRLGGGRPVAALLLPLSGPLADVGRSMERAARLTQAAPDDLVVIDTTPGAAAATRQAISRGVPLILGPVEGGSVAETVAAAGAVPVVAFTNDGSRVGGGAFVLGVTPSQSVSTVLSYARERGVRRVAMLTGTDPWTVQAEAAARRIAPAVGLELVPEAATADAPPDAVLITALSPERRLRATVLRDIGAQPLAAVADPSADALLTLEGAWAAAPDADAAADVAAAFQSRHGVAPGMLALLAYDAVGLARRVAAGGRPAREALIDPSGHPAVTGPLRFTADGACVRRLAIVVPTAGALRVVDRRTAA